MHFDKALDKNLVRFLRTLLGSKLLPLKAVDTIGNCQGLVFTVGVSQHMHKIT